MSPWLSSALGNLALIMKATSILSEPVRDIHLRIPPLMVVLVGIAALLLFTGFIAWYANRTDADVSELRWFLYTHDRVTLEWFDWAIVLSGCVYLFLAVAALRFPRSAVSVGLVCYLGFATVHAFQGRLEQGFVTTVLVGILLFTGVMVAFRQRHQTQVGC
jgi:hypothetical protein